MNDNRIMGDSTVLSDIPLTVDVAASYLTGSYAISRTALNARFPHTLYGHCMFDTNGSRPDADARDWETGDKSGSLRQWVLDHNAHAGKKNAVIYCNRSTMGEVHVDTGRLVCGKDWFFLVATLDGEMFEGDGVIGCQRDGEGQTGGHWDRSFLFNGTLWLPVRRHGKPDCTKLQEAVRTHINDEWDSMMKRHMVALRHASRSPASFPLGIVLAQQVVGASANGHWSLACEEAVKETVTHVQEALITMGFNPHGVDGIWGPNTEKAVDAAHKACTS